MGFEGIYGDQYKTPSCTLSSLSRQMADSIEVTFIDVRTLKEIELRPAPWEGAMHIALLELESRTHELTSLHDKPIVVICPTGRRSSEGARILCLAGYDASYVEDGMFGSNE